MTILIIIIIMIMINDKKKENNDKNNNDNNNCHHWVSADPLSRSFFNIFVFLLTFFFFIGKAFAPKH